MINEVCIKHNKVLNYMVDIPTSNINVGCYMFDFFAEGVTMLSLSLAKWVPSGSHSNTQKL